MRDAAPPPACRAPPLATRFAAGPRFYGPVILAVVSLAAVSGMIGQSFLLGRFRGGVEADLGLPGTRGAGWYTLATLAGGLALLPAGPRIDRLGVRRTTLLTLTFLLGSTLLLAEVRAEWMLPVAFLGLRFFGQGVMEVVTENTVAAWYRRRLGRASIAMRCAAALGLLVLPAAADAAIAAIGWRWTLRVAALCLCVSLAAAWLLLADTPAAVGQEVDGENAAAPGVEGPEPRGQAGGHPPPHRPARSVFPVLSLAFGGFALATTGLVYCLSPVLAEAGRDPRWGGGLLAAMGAAMLVVYPLAGGAADRVPVRWLQAAGLAAVAAALVLLTTARSPAAVLTVGVLLGASLSAQAVVASTAWARYFGLTGLGRVRARVQTVAVTCSALGPFLLEAAAAATGSYRVPLLALAAAAVPLILLVLRLPPPPTHRPDAA